MIGGAIAADPYFPPDEALYRRINPRDVGADARLVDPDAAFAFPDDSGISVNRQRYSGSPADCLGERRDWAIGCFLVRQIPTDIAANNGQVYRFQSEHWPVGGNPGHSEIRSYADGVFVPRPPKDVRLLFRLHVGAFIQII